MLTPKARGSLSDQVFTALREGAPGSALASVNPDDAADAHITLWALYEQHYRGFEDVDVALEWHPTLIALRGELEEWFAEQLVHRFVPRRAPCRSRSHSSHLSRATRVPRSRPTSNARRAPTRCWTC